MERLDRDNCPLEAASQVLGDKWAMLILREMFLEGPAKFRDLELVLGINPSTLTNRLKRLEDQKIISKQMYSRYPPRAQYVLTEQGQSLAPVFDSLRAWGRERLKNR